jgi:tRNA wybutosine-synthesizing protein 2
MEKLKRLLSETVPEDKRHFLPDGFQRIGDVIVLKLHEGVYPCRKRIAGKLLRETTAKTICNMRQVSGELRRPRIEKVAGNGTETIHRENGCTYKLDVARVMFSKGNLRERGRLPGIVRRDEVIVDMFAGIGYFTIPVAKTGLPRRIYAIDANPDSIRYLKENLRLNKVGCVEPVLGDSRNVALSEQADRIIMGYLPRTYEFLPSAFKLLKPAGVIHYHDTFSRDELWEKPLEILERGAGRAGFSLKSVSYKAIVKHYAPGVEHVVIDAEFRKN